MNKSDRLKLKLAGDDICKLWKITIEEQPDNPWHKVGYKQALRDALEMMEHRGLIKDYDIYKGVTPC